MVPAGNAFKHLCRDYCSDGIHDYVDIDFMEDTFNRDDLSLGEKADLLILQALKLESEDDKTVLIVEL